MKGLPVFIVGFVLMCLVAVYGGCFMEEAKADCTWFNTAEDGKFVYSPEMEPGFLEPCYWCGDVIYKLQVLDIDNESVIVELSDGDASTANCIYTCEVNSIGIVNHPHYCDERIILHFLMKFPNPIEDYEIDETWAFGQLEN